MSIGVVLNSVLKGSIALQALVGDKIYPYAIEEDTTLPGILYRIVSIKPEYDKSGLIQDNNEVEVLTYTKTYSECLAISREIRGVLELLKGEIVQDINVKSSRIQEITEGFDFDTEVYFNTINFLIITN